MYMEQFAVLLLMAATHIAQPGSALPGEAAATKPAGDEALRLRIEHGFSDTAMRQAQRKRTRATRLDAPHVIPLQLARQTGE